MSMVRAVTRPQTGFWAEPDIGDSLSFQYVKGLENSWLEVSPGWNIWSGLSQAPSAVYLLTQGLFHKKIL
jgi:hypothetical protein